MAYRRGRFRSRYKRGYGRKRRRGFRRKKYYVSRGGIRL